MEYHIFMPGVGRPSKLEPSPLGECIKRARTAAGFSQTQLAEKLGVTQQTITQWERRASAIHSQNLIALAKVLDISADELLGLETGKGTPGPVGKARKIFSELSELPRHEQAKIIDVVEGFIKSYKMEHQEG